MLCHLAVQRARREYEESGGDDAATASASYPSSQQTSPRHNGGGFQMGCLGADYGVDMTERMLTLESRLGHIERQRRVRKARTLLQCADWVIGAQTLSLLLAGALLGHYAALWARLRGWDAAGVAWLQEMLPASSSPYLEAAFGAAAGGVDAYWPILVGGMLVAGAVAASTLYRRSVTAFSVVRFWLSGVVVWCRGLVVDFGLDYLMVDGHFMHNTNTKPHGRPPC